MSVLEQRNRELMAENRTLRDRIRDIARTAGIQIAGTIGDLARKIQKKILSLTEKQSVSRSSDRDFDFDRELAELQKEMRDENESEKLR
jgi:hypothetical protein